MKRTVNTSWLMAILATGMLMLSACSEGDEEKSDVRSNIQATEAIGVSYNGEWTVDKQVVDTARLKMTDVLTVRLPEAYLVSLCFSGLTEEYGTDKATLSTGTAIEPMGQPIKIVVKDQGYTNDAVFSDFMNTAEKYDSTTLYRSAYFVVNVNGDNYVVELLSTENGNAVYRADTMGWTIAIPIDRFRITNVKTLEERVKRLANPITLYYNTKERIMEE